MNVGEIISTLALCASDMNNDHLLMLRDVCYIECYGECIIVHFMDGSTNDVRIFTDGKRKLL